MKQTNVDAQIRLDALDRLIAAMKAVSADADAAAAELADALDQFFVAVRRKVGDLVGDLDD